MMIAGDILGNFEFNVCMPNAKVFQKETPAMKVHIDENGQLIINMNKEYAFRILANKDLLVAGLNKKLSELIQTHLNKKAQEEHELEGGK